VNLNSPIPDEWSSYVTQTNLGLEIIPHMLYSVKSYVSASTTILTFFDFVRGSRPDLTNMQQPNMLPNPESFLIQNIRIFSWGNLDAPTAATPPDVQASQFNDLVELTKRGIMEMKIGNKSYGPWPLWTLPAHNFVKGAVASATVDLTYGQVDGMLYSLFPNLMISPLQQFSVSLTWPGGAITLGGAESPEEPPELPLEILFDGQLARSVQ
jgi:hypothetical protein